MNFAHSEVATLDPNTMRTLCEEYVANNYIDPETSERLGVKRGLRNPDGTGVLAGLTNVCDVVGYKKDQEGHVIPTPGKLIYRGVNINEIVDEAYRNDRFVFEEVIWLLLFGSLPNREQLDDFCEILAEHRALPEGFMDTMNAPSPNIMNKLQRCVLGLYSYDEHAEDLSLENILSQSINLIASMPTMMVNAYQMKRRYYDKQSMFFHLPKPGQSTAEHILSTYRPDQKFTHEEAKLLDMCLLVHADHGGGMKAVIAAFPVHTFYSSVTSSSNGAFQRVMRAAETANLTITVPGVGDTFTLGGATVTVLGPQKHYSDVNDQSLILRVDYGSNAFLFTGDAEYQSETDVLDAGENVRCDVIKAGHHGSRTSTGYRLLYEAQPKYAVISCGAGNEYGHPHDDTLSRLRDADVTVYRTDLNGTVVCRSDGTNLTFTTEKEG